MGNMLSVLVRGFVGINGLLSEFMISISDRTTIVSVIMWI